VSARSPGFTSYRAANVVIPRMLSKSSLYQHTCLHGERSVGLNSGKKAEGSILTGGRDGSFLWGQFGQRDRCCIP
jgi:hypothetical protein